ncbi:MAG TPA: isocitrate/isopropylmalate family dehydrogenase, partial [Flavisolibacter sp.]|nr:isocitrate/isopropylmalate family dehydrogenase [Flavisolibacter sp.]
LAGSANIGDGFAMFEAIHGSAPRIAGQNKANPSGLLLAAVQMLVHIGQKETAETIHNAWLKALEDGAHTYDIYKEGSSKQKLSTSEFAEAVIARLGQQPASLSPANYAQSIANFTIKVTPQPPAQKTLTGVDVFVQATGTSPDTLAQQLLPANNERLTLRMITNRGTKVWPNGFPETFCTDHWRCRFQSDKALTFKDILELLGRVEGQQLDVIKTEHLYLFNGEAGYTAAQGQ